MSEFDLDIMFARAKVCLWEKLERLRGIPGLTFTDFGTRRRAGFLWQDYVVGCLKDELLGQFLGTSNTLIAMHHDLEAMGTNAHELQMVAAALKRPSGDPEALRRGQYTVLRQWADTYQDALRIILPDTWGTTQFLANAPDWVTGWTGLRVDSKSPVIAGEEYIAWLQARGVDPKDKLLLFSDGLDVEDILQLYARFGGVIQPGQDADTFTRAMDFAAPDKWSHKPRIRVSFGWGTLLTNDFRQCHPRQVDLCKPISVICKVVEVNGLPAVKLSDNYLKAIGPDDEVAYYRSVFGSEGLTDLPVRV
jgi:nicotinate phosphoribosyltransferase